MGERGDKYEAKINGDVRKKLYDSQKDSMVAKESTHTKALVAIEEKVKELVGNVSLLHLPYYIIFGKQIYKRQNKMAGQTLLNELAILDQIWTDRGLDPALLVAIKHHFVPAYPLLPPIGPFRLDISLLDGPDTLV